MTAATYTAQLNPPGAAHGRGLRGDIEGLRAIAVLMVLAYHVGFTTVSGGFAGVDVFFVISGFLITTQLLKELDRNGTISLVGFYARRARRLLPAATVVLVFTAAAGVVLLPAGRLPDLATDVAASAVYVVNWALAGRSVDYLAEDAAVSPLQHYWSLSVEEQFYLFWPLLILIAVAVARRRVSARRLVVVLLTTVLLASLLWSVVHTASSPQTSYFVTTTRVWELAVGAVIACSAPALARLHRGIAQGVAVAGVAAVIGAAVVVGAGTPWPGSAALLPVLGTGAVIAAGCAHPDTVVGRLLGTAPMRWVGGRSYAIYLWHWPLLVFAPILWPGLGLWGMSAVALVSVVLSWLTGRYVEDPIRYGRTLSRRPGLALAGGALGMAVSVGAAGVVLAAVPEQAQAPTTAQGGISLMERGGSGSALRADPDLAFTRTGPVWPEPALAARDVPTYYADDCQTGQDDPEIVEGCVYGAVQSDTVVAVVGDSKMGQWMPALQEIAAVEGWRLELYLKSACAFADVPQLVSGREYDSCTEWNAKVLDRLTDPASAADIVLTSQGRSTAGPPAFGQEAAPEMVAGLARHWTALLEAGSQVVALADTPAPSNEGLPVGSTVYECVDASPQDYWACSFPGNRGYGTAALTAAVERVQGVELVDLKQWICPGEVCRPVIGKQLVYRQGSHITATYAQSLAPVLHRELIAAGVASAAPLPMGAPTSGDGR